MSFLKIHYLQYSTLLKPNINTSILYLFLRERQTFKSAGVIPVVATARLFSAILHVIHFYQPRLPKPSP